MVVGHVSWADADRFGPGYWNGWAVGPKFNPLRGNLFSFPPGFPSWTFLSGILARHPGNSERLASYNSLRFYNVFFVQLQMTCTEKHWCLNREWTQIHANSRIDQCGLISNDSSKGASSALLTREQLFFTSFDIYSRSFASIRGSVLYSIDAAKVVDALICTQFSYTE